MFLQFNIILAKSKSYHPNRRGGKAHGGGGNRSESKTQSYSSSQGSASRGRGQFNTRGAHPNTNNMPQNSKRADRLPDLGKKNFSVFEKFRVYFFSINA